MNSRPAEKGRGDASVPRRAVLLSPEPIGLGTAQAESLTSYFTRVSFLNGLSPWQLMWGTNCAPLTKSDFNILNLRRWGRPNFHRRAISTASAGKTFAEVLAAMLGRPALRRLHWGTTFTRFALAGMNRSCEIWCSECLRTDSVPYCRMLWELPFVTHCLVHKCTLQTRCRVCGRTVRLAGVNDASHCRYCGSDRRTQIASPRPSKYDSLAESMGDLIAQMTFPGSTLQCDSFDCIANIQKLASACTSIAAKAQLLGISPVTLWQWQQRRALPSFVRVVEIARRLNIPPVDIFSGTVATVARRPRALTRPQRAAKMRLTSGQKRLLVSNLQELSRRFPSWSVRRVASSLGVRDSFLWQIATQQCAAVAASSRIHRERIRAAKWMWFKRKLDSYIAVCIEKAVVPTLDRARGQFRHQQIFWHKEYSSYASEAVRAAKYKHASTASIRSG